MAVALLEKPKIWPKKIQTHYTVSWAQWYKSNGEKKLVVASKFKHAEKLTKQHEWLSKPTPGFIIHVDGVVGHISAQSDGA